MFIINRQQTMLLLVSKCRNEFNPRHMLIIALNYYYSTVFFILLAKLYTFAEQGFSLTL